jgi:hypothetical protein
MPQLHDLKSINKTDMNFITNPNTSFEDISFKEVKQRKEIILEVAINLDLHFWAILPALNINLHSKEFEFEWLCIGIYIGKK